jgi:cytochrome c biogenesis protein CcdA
VAPILAAVAAFALSTGGFATAFLAFLIFALTMAGLMMLVSVLVASMQPVLLRRLRASSRGFQRVANIVLVAVGGGVIYFSVNVEAARWLFVR